MLIVYLVNIIEISLTLRIRHCSLISKVEGEIEGVKRDGV